MKKLRAAVIGLGQIGLGYDYEEKGDKIVATHASAFANNDQYHLVGGVDSDGVRRAAFTKKYSQPAFQTVDDLFKQTNSEVVALAVPTKLHPEMFEQVLQHKPKAIICEKPLAADLASAEKMIIAARKADCPVLVNYHRRFEPGVNKLKSLIQSGVLGEIHKGVVWYSKGILNNGSHYIDLLLWLLGDATQVKVLNKGRKYNNVDPEPDVMIKFGNAEVYFLACQEENFSIVDLELIGTRGKVKYAALGADIQYQTSRPDPIYPGYTILNPKSNKIKSDIHRSQWYVGQHLAEYLAGKTNDLVSSAGTALETMKIIKEITNE